MRELFVHLITTFSKRSHFKNRISASKTACVTRTGTSIFARNTFLRDRWSRKSWALGAMFIYLFIYLTGPEVYVLNFLFHVFIQRYGWHGNDALLQQSFDVAAVKYPWINKHREKSVTELEYLHGHLNNPGERAACFFFRDKVCDLRMRKIIWVNCG